MSYSNRVAECGVVMVSIGTVFAGSVALAQPLPQAYSIERIGLIGPQWTNRLGNSGSGATNFNAALSQVVGTSQRFGSNGLDRGRNLWVWSPGRGTSQIGLTDAAHTSANGTQNGEVFFQSPNGVVAGYSERPTGEFGQNGQSAWAWTDEGGTRQLGFFGAGYVGSGGYAFSAVRLQNSQGQVVGTSNRISGVSTYAGERAWVWTPQGGTIAIGLSGGNHTTPSGFQASIAVMQSDSGHVAGTSTRYNGEAFNGNDAWVWTPEAGSRTVGLNDPVHSGSNGYRSNFVKPDSTNGFVAGVTRRYTGVNTEIGEDAWIWTEAEGTTQVGLTGGDYTGSAGVQSSLIQRVNASGQVAGTSSRYQGVSTQSGQDAWVRTTDGTTRVVGLMGAEFSGTGGERFSDVISQSPNGQVAGMTRRYRSPGVSNGEAAWAWSSEQGTERVGLTGPEFTGSNAYQLSQVQRQNADGDLAGFSRRLAGISSDRGRTIWVSLAGEPGARTTQRASLAGPDHISAGGQENATLLFQNDAGHVAGTNVRYPGGNSQPAGTDSWVWTPQHGTRLLGLTDAGHMAGTQRTSTVEFLNGSGDAAGFSLRSINNVGFFGQDAWYFDSATGMSTGITGSVRQDGFARSVASVLTDDGYLFGHYLHFEGGVGDGVEHGFVFRPDIGMTDLGGLVDGGLSPNGWSLLGNPMFARSVKMIVGNGAAFGQTSNGSVYVMTIPSSGALTTLLAAGLLAARRSRFVR